MGEAFFQMTGVFAQLERDLIRQRTMEGLEAARARGRTGGRKPKLAEAWGPAAGHGVSSWQRMLAG
jgi:DNA invertase Pin-like site-specific DNA recombinase